jgi:hypothetical protein
MPEAAAAIRHPKPKSSSVMDEGAGGTAVKAADVVVKPDDVDPSGEVGVFEAAAGPSKGVQIVEEGKVDAVEANEV